MGKRAFSTFVVGYCLAASLVACGSDDETGGAGGSSGSGGSAGAAGSAGVGGGAGSGASGGSAGAAGSGGTAGGGGSAGTAGSAGSTSLTERRVFVTSQQFDGALGGLSGADGQCQKLAEQAGLGGSWLAWLSDDTTSPVDRFVKSTVPYVLVGGATIAQDWSDLTDGTIDVPIDHDETGTALAASDNRYVWTATQPSGVGVFMHCLGYTDNTSSSSPRGSVDSTTQWSIASPGYCTDPNHLYCFEK